MKKYPEYSEYSIIKDKNFLRKGPIENKRKQSPFSHFVINGISFLEDAKSIWNSISQSKEEKDRDIVEYQEMHKIANLARSAESFIKALLLTYDEIILFQYFF